MKRHRAWLLAFLGIAAWLLAREPVPLDAAAPASPGRPAAHFSVRHP